MNKLLQRPALEWSAASERLAEWLDQEETRLDELEEQGRVSPIHIKKRRREIKNIDRYMTTCRHLIKWLCTARRIHRIDPPELEEAQAEANHWRRKYCLLAKFARFYGIDPGLAGYLKEEDFENDPKHI